MFSHNFKYALKTLLKNKTLLFWTFAFPIILGTLFQLAFSDIEKKESLDTISIAIVADKNHMLIEQLKKIEHHQKSLFKVFNKNEEEAKKLLEKNQISGYLLIDDSVKIVVKENGINQTVLKFAVDEILQVEEMMKRMISSENFDIDEAIYKKLEAETLNDISNSHMSYTMIEFYTLIAMTALYGGILGLYIINQNLANQSANGKRISIGPISKIKIIMSSAFAAYIVQLIGIAFLFFYMIVVLKIDYSQQFMQILLLTLLGCFAGLSMGIMIASIVKGTENTKVGIVIAVTMLGCFLSGMMGITMKYIIDKNIPILNIINPANMITDGFYSLYYYTTSNRYYFNIISLILFSLLMIVISIHSLRRQTYDSI